MDADSGVLIVGLGNPGTRYDKTRHNFGFMVVDALIEGAGGDMSLAPAKTVKGGYHLWKGRLARDAGPLFLAKPLTFMNLCGAAVAELCRYYRIPPDRLLVIHDELDLALGRMKFKCGGGAAGHKGVASIAERLGSKDFYRLRLGIGKPLVGETADFVLSRFRAEETPLAEQMVKAAAEGAGIFLQRGPTAAMQSVNAFKAPLSE